MIVVIKTYWFVSQILSYLPIGLVANKLEVAHIHSEQLTCVLKNKLENGAWIANWKVDDAGPPPKMTAAQTCISGKLPPQMLAPPTTEATPQQLHFCQTLTWQISGSFPHLWCLLLKKRSFNSHSSVSLFIPTKAGISNNGKSRALTEHCCMPLLDLVSLQKKVHNLWLSCTFKVALVLYVKRIVWLYIWETKCSLVNVKYFIALMKGLLIWNHFAKMPNTIFVNEDLSMIAQMKHCDDNYCFY